MTNNLQEVLEWVWHGWFTGSQQANLFEKFLYEFDNLLTYFFFIFSFFFFFQFHCVIRRYSKQKKKLKITQKIKSWSFLFSLHGNYYLFSYKWTNLFSLNFQFFTCVCVCTVYLPCVHCRSLSLLYSPRLHSSLRLDYNTALRLLCNAISQFRFCNRLHFSIFGNTL